MSRDEEIQIMRKLARAAMLVLEIVLVIAATASAIAAIYVWLPFGWGRVWLILLLLGSCASAAIVALRANGFFRAMKSPLVRRLIVAGIGCAALLSTFYVSMVIALNVRGA
jgi:hypothetical protein